MTAKYFLKKLLRQNENESRNLEELFKVLNDFLSFYKDWSGNQDRAEVDVITKRMEELRLEVTQDVATAPTQEALETNFISEEEIWERRRRDSYYVEEF